MDLVNSTKGSALIREQTGRPCSRQNLEKLCKSGRLPESTECMAPLRLRSEMLVKEYLTVVDPRQAFAIQPKAAPRQPQSAEHTATDLRSISESRELREHYEAESARLKAEQLAGALVPVAEMEALMFGHIRQARDALLGVPAQVLDQLCALLGNLSADQRHEVTQLLDKELVRVTTNLARLPVQGGADAR